MEYGNSDFDVRQHLVVSLCLGLAIRKGQSLCRKRVGILESVDRQLASGRNRVRFHRQLVHRHRSVREQFEYGLRWHGGISTARDQMSIGDPNGKPCMPGTFYNTCAFASDLVQGTFGNEGRNIMHGPGYQTWDLSMLKTFPVREQMRV